MKYKEELVAITAIAALASGFVFFANTFFWSNVHESDTLPAPVGTTMVPVTPKAGPLDIYPEVPGVANLAVTQDNIQQTICKSGWTATVRPTSTYISSLKKRQIVDFNLQDTTLGDYEEDHLVSLELGGSPDDPNNLWPEPYTASIPDGGARTKDQVENYLHREVCAGRMSLNDARLSIVTDWYAVYVNDLKGKYGGVGDQTDPDDE